MIIVLRNLLNWWKRAPPEALCVMPLVDLLIFNAYIDIRYDKAEFYDTKIAITASIHFESIASANTVFWTFLECYFELKWMDGVQKIKNVNSSALVLGLCDH